MLRHRLVRQSAFNNSSGSENGSSMTSSPPTESRHRKSTQDGHLYRQLSSESLDSLLTVSSPVVDHRSRKERRHSVACGGLNIEHHKPSFKAAFNTAVRRMSDACSLFSSAPSSTYNLSPPQPEPKKDEVLLPHVLGTFQQKRFPQLQQSKNNFQVNRRFSTDCPPPSYMDATKSWHQLSPRQKYLSRQNDITSKSSLIAVEDDDHGSQE